MEHRVVNPLGDRFALGSLRLREELSTELGELRTKLKVNTRQFCLKQNLLGKNFSLQKEVQMRPESGSLFHEIPLTPKGPNLL